MVESILPELTHQTFIGFLEHSLGTSNFEIIPLAGDASDRKYYRIIKEDKSWVLMSWKPFENPEQYPFLSVHQLFKNHNIQVPDVLFISPSEGLILLEDLGDLTLERKFWENQNQEILLPYYKQAIDEIIKIHFSTSSDNGSCCAFKIQFDVEKLKWELDYTYQNLLIQFCQLTINQNTFKELENIFLNICERLSSEPKVVCHRDYHSRNLMLKLGKMRVIDFQDARLGTVQYDLVSLLKDSYVDLGPGLSQEILKYYYAEAQMWKAPLAQWDYFLLIYELQSVQRCFKACGSFSSFYNSRKDLRYLKYISPTLQRVKKSLSYFPQYKMFDQFLNDHGLYEMDFLK